MNLGEQLLAALSQYGVSILAAVLFAGCVGVPLPNALLLIASGAFVAGGQMKLWTVLVVACAAAIGGDLAGYSIGRWLGPAALRRLNPAIRERIDKAETSVRKWGSWGIFLTRWLITPAGPWVNLISGASQVPWPQFVLWDVFGEIVWVVLYVSLGRVIAGEVQSISALAGDIVWLTLAFFVVAVLAWRVWKSRQKADVS